MRYSTESLAIVALLAAHIASPIKLVGGEFTTPALGKIKTVKSEEWEAARLAHLDPLKDGWDTEEFSREADRQLIRLSALLRQGTPGTERITGRDIRGSITRRPSHTAGPTERL